MDGRLPVRWGVSESELDSLPMWRPDFFFLFVLVFACFTAWFLFMAARIVRHDMLCVLFR